MEAVVLAAGEGLRMRPLTHSMPKVMLRVANRPILEYGIKALAKSGIRDIVMVVGYRRDQIMSYFEDGKKWGVRIRYVVEEKQMGTAHALYQAKDVVSDEFIVYPGDNILGEDSVSRFVKETKGSRGNAVLVVESSVPSKYGVVIARDEKVVGIEKKVEPGVGMIINTGVYHMDKDIFPEIERNMREGKYAIKDVLLDMARRNRYFRAVLAQGRWVDAVYPWDLIRANADVLEKFTGGKIGGVVSASARIDGPVIIGEGSVIRENCRITGPVVIGSGCEIGPGVVISPSTSIGDNVKIEPFVVIENSLIMEDATIGPFSRIQHSVVGRGVRFDGNLTTMVGDTYVEVEEKGGKTFVEAKRVGCVIGEDTNIGSNVVLLPGTIVGVGCEIVPVKRLSGRIEDGSNVL